MPTFTIPPLTADVITAAMVILVLRVFGVTLATVRVLVMMRGLKLLSAVMGFFEVLVYVLAIGQVINDLENVWNLLGYCLGFALGTLIGMAIEERLALGYATVRVVSRFKGHNLAQAIHEAGYGATVEWGQGRDGAVSVVMTTVRRKEVAGIVKLAEEVDPDAFVTVEETRTIRRGYMRIARHER